MTTLNQAKNYRDVLAKKLKSIDTTGLDADFKHELKEVLLEKYEKNKEYKEAKTIKNTANKNEKIIKDFYKIKTAIDFNKKYPGVKAQKIFLETTLNELNKQDSVYPLLTLRSFVLKSNDTKNLIETKILDQINQKIENKLVKFNDTFNNIFDEYKGVNIDAMNLENFKKMTTTVENLVKDDRLEKDVIALENFSRSALSTGIKIPNGIFMNILRKKEKEKILTPLINAKRQILLGNTRNDG